MAEIASSWFSVRRYSDGVSLVWEPHIIAKTRCNIWYIRGRERDLMVDTGFGLVSLRKSLPFLAGRQVLAVATHTHFDHVGGHFEFTHRAVHPLEADILQHPTRQNTVADLYVTGATFTAYPDAEFCPSRYGVRPAPATLLIDEGDVIDLGDRQFQVFHVPGHSPGSIALWEAATGTMFSGDAVYDGPLSDGLYHSDREVYTESMRRLREFPVRVVHGGHYESFGRDRFIAIIDSYLSQQAES